MGHGGVAYTGVLHSAAQGITCKRALKHNVLCVCVHASAHLTVCVYVCPGVHTHTILYTHTYPKHYIVLWEKYTKQRHDLVLAAFRAKHKSSFRPCFHIFSK